MRTKELRTWKKVFESDLSYIVIELKEMITTPSLIILEGELGAGKTTFAKEFIESEGGESFSPSYSVLSETNTCVHGDFYRVKSREEILHLELGLYLDNKNFVFIEWGKDHFYSLIKELPEDFSYYLLRIETNEATSDGEAQSRNFFLEEIFEH